MLNQDKLGNCGIISIVTSIPLYILDINQFAIPLFMVGGLCAMIAYSWEFVPKESRHVLKNYDIYADFKRHLKSSSDLSNAVAMAKALPTDDFIRLVRVMCEARYSGTDEAMKLATELFKKERK